MMRWALLILLGLITACSHTPHWPALEGDCLDATPKARASVGLLQVYSDRGRHNLVVHRERNAEQITYVALDAIGAPQFTATQTPTGFTVEQSPLYRGVDPQWLLWGWQWWLLRERLSLECATSAGLELQPLFDAHGWQLNQGARTAWRWSSGHPDQYELPEQQARVTVRELETTELDVTTE